MALCVCTCAILLSACSAGWNHTSDAVLERRFRLQQTEFQTLLAEVQADSQLTTVQRASLVYAGRLVNLSETDLSEIERLGLPMERWTRYQKQLKTLGLNGVLKGNGDAEFRVDAGSIFNGDSYKGYMYFSTPPAHCRTSLDGYRISDEDKDEFGNWAVCMLLKGNWYLYLFVNR
jgi:hypothetical protein